MRGNNITYRNVAGVTPASTTSANALIRDALNAPETIFSGLSDAVGKYSDYREENDTEALQTQLRGLADNDARTAFLSNLTQDELGFADRGDLTKAAATYETQDIARRADDRLSAQEAFRLGNEGLVTQGLEEGIKASQAKTADALLGTKIKQEQRQPLLEQIKSNTKKTDAGTANIEEQTTSSQATTKREKSALEDRLKTNAQNRLHEGFGENRAQQEHSSNQEKAAALLAQYEQTYEFTEGKNVLDLKKLEQAIEFGDTAEVRRTLTFLQETTKNNEATETHKKNLIKADKYIQKAQQAYDQANRMDPLKVDAKNQAIAKAALELQNAKTARGKVVDDEEVRKKNFADRKVVRAGIQELVNIKATTDSNGIKETPQSLFQRKNAKLNALLEKAEGGSMSESTIKLLDKQKDKVISSFENMSPDIGTTLVNRIAKQKGPGVDFQLDTELKPEDYNSDLKANLVDDRYLELHEAFPWMAKKEAMILAAKQTTTAIGKNRNVNGKFTAEANAYANKLKVATETARIAAKNAVAPLEAKLKARERILDIKSKAEYSTAHEIFGSEVSAYYASMADGLNLDSPISADHIRRDTNALHSALTDQGMSVGDAAIMTRNLLLDGRIDDPFNAGLDGWLGTDAPGIRIKGPDNVYYRVDQLVSDDINILASIRNQKRTSETRTVDGRVASSVPLKQYDNFTDRSAAKNFDAQLKKASNSVKLRKANIVKAKERGNSTVALTKGLRTQEAKVAEFTKKLTDLNAKVLADKK